MLAIRLVGNFPPLFRTVQKRLISSRCFWGVRTTVRSTVAGEIDGKSCKANVSIVIVELRKDLFANCELSALV